MDFSKKENKSETEMSNNTDSGVKKDIQVMTNSQPYHYGQPQYKNAREYAQAVQCWLLQYRMLTAVGAFHSCMMNSMSQANGSHQHYNSTTHTPGQPIVQPAGQQAQAEQNRNTADRSPIIHLQGTQYKIPLLWRRVAAELLDFVLLFYAKILITVSLLRQMGYVNENVLDLEPQFDFLADITEMDYNKMFALTTELIALEIVNRVCVTIVETLCIRHGYAGSIGGATPGKKIMHLRVISYDQITDLRNNRVLVVGERDPGFMNALVRSAIKNFSMAFFFPACFTVFFFKFNRAAYDILSQTVVVEVNRL